MADASRVVIGLTTEVIAPPWYQGRRRYQLFTDYSECLRRAGAVPVLIPGDATAEDLDLLLDRVDGIVATGGDDMDLRFQGGPAPTPECKPVPAEQQQMNLDLLERVLQLDMPLLAVCFGMQALGLLRGSGFVQHLSSHHQHTKGVEHQVQLLEQSHLAQITNSRCLTVPSFHHQALKDVPGDRLQVTGLADDGTIEAVEVHGQTFAIGVQWHPERAPDSNASKAIFSRFVAAAAAYRK
ncbi:MAG: gamma-glutamyl-gamma-aminobutyrate hydrolase family protein [Planctomycetes bacterium]|nr:gamma-glutamyl-gamma-aminobutyrate hydrolase family protein [Planctomycetota bacterium]